MAQYIDGFVLPVPKKNNPTDASPLGIPGWGTSASSSMAANFPIEGAGIATRLMGLAL